MQVAISQKFGWEGTALLRKTTGCGQTEARSPTPRCGGLVSQGGGSAWCWWTASGRLPSAWTAGVSSLSLQVTNLPSQQDQQHRLHRHQQQHQKEQQQGIQRKPQILACLKHLPGENKCSAFYKNLFHSHWIFIKVCWTGLTFIYFVPPHLHPSLLSFFLGEATSRRASSSSSYFSSSDLHCGDQ